MGDYLISFSIISTNIFILNVIKARVREAQKRFFGHTFCFIWHVVDLQNYYFICDLLYNISSDTQGSKQVYCLFEKSTMMSWNTSISLLSSKANINMLKPWVLRNILKIGTKCSNNIKIGVSVSFDFVKNILFSIYLLSQRAWPLKLLCRIYRSLRSSIFCQHLANS